MIEIKITGFKKKEKKETDGKEISTTKRVMFFILGTFLAFVIVVGGMFLANFIWYNSGEKTGRVEGYVLEKDHQCFTNEDHYILLDNGVEYDVYSHACNLVEVGDKVLVQWNKAPWFKYQGIIVEWL